MFSVCHRDTPLCGRARTFVRPLSLQLACLSPLVPDSAALPTLEWMHVSFRRTASRMVCDPQAGRARVEASGALV